MAMFGRNSETPKTPIEEAVQALAPRLKALDKVQREYAVIVEKVIAAVEPVVAMRPTAPNFLPDLKALLRASAAALEDLAVTSQDYANRIAVGSEPLHRPSPPSQAPEQIPVQAARTEVYANVPLKWTERGQIMTVGRYAVTKMPADVADIAIARNLADTLSSSRAQKLISCFGIVNGPAHVDDCLSLDPVEAQPATQPQQQFIERVGPARQMTIAVDRI
jgi:hypothetical protein